MKASKELGESKEYEHGNRKFNMEDALSTPAPEPKVGLERIHEITGNTGDASSESNVDKYYGGKPIIQYPLILVKGMATRRVKDTLDNYLNSNQSLGCKEVTLMFSTNSQDREVIVKWRVANINIDFLNLLETLGLSYIYYQSKGEVIDIPKEEFLNLEEIRDIICPKEELISDIGEKELDLVDYSEADLIFGVTENKPLQKESKDYNELIVEKDEIVVEINKKDLVDESEIKEISEQKDTSPLQQINKEETKTTALVFGKGGE